MTNEELLAEAWAFIEPWKHPGRTLLTAEFLVSQLVQAIANTQADAWDEGYQEGWNDTNDYGNTPNPHRQTKDGASV
jgi:hypothetical protein